jgi:hypothetical protein
MTVSTFKFDINDLNIDLLKIEDVLGYKEGDDRDIVNALLEEIMVEKELFSGIRAEYKIFDNIEFVDSDKSLTISNINFETHKTIFGQLKKSDSIALFLCTAGKEFGIRSRKAMNEGDPLKSYIYDIVGSIVVDATADMMQSELEKSARAVGKKNTNRYNPGYCGWNITEQHKLFQLMPDNFCGIRLNESALMDPEKSLSGIIGIGESVRFNRNVCNLCDMKNCQFREKNDQKVKKRSITV